MNAIRNLKIGKRLTLGFGLALVLMMGIAALGINSMAAIQHRLIDITDNTVEEIRLANTMRISVDEAIATARDIVLLKEKTDMQAAVESLKQSRANYDTAESALGKRFEDPEVTAAERDLFKKIQGLKATARPSLNKVVELGLENRNEDATKLLMTDTNAKQKAWLAALGELTALEQKLTAQEVADASASYRWSRNSMAMMCALGLALGGAAAWLITRSITCPIAQAVAVARTVASGDLTSRIDAAGTDETGELLAALKEMNDSLVKVVNSVRAGSDSIATGSGQIAIGNADLSQRTEEQASNLQPTAASMEQLNATVKNNADSARQATLLAASANAPARAALSARAPA